MVLNVSKPTDVTGLTLEAWAQGYLVGSLLVMACIAVANMRKRVLLHKLIVLELLLGMFHGTFIFTNPPVYNWYLSTTAIFLNISWSLHNVIAWMKSKPFLGRRASLFYIGTVILVQPYWVVEITANFLYFSDTNELFVHTRPYEALFRDPWWIFTVLNLLWNIKTKYGFKFLELVRVSPRFGVMLAAMILSICFVILDILAVTKVIAGKGLPDGINPFWKLSFVFKCLTDTVILDDFKTALDRLKQYNLNRMGSILGDDIHDDFSNFQQTKEKRVEKATHINFVDVNAAALNRGTASVHTRDWSRSQSDYLDIEAALQIDSKNLADD